jgi:renalase
MHLAIIGAGAAGLAAARALRQRRPDIRITVFEKSRGLGGRAATRRRDGFIFDHGAQFFRTPTPELERLVRHDLPADALRDIGLPVWAFDAAGRIAEGDPSQNAEPAWTYADGISRLGKLLGEGLDVRRETRIAQVEDARPLTKDESKPPHTRALAAPAEAAFDDRPSSIVPRRWSLLDTAGQAHGPFDALLLTPPAPQTADLLAASALDEALKAPLLAELRQARYRRCLSLTLAYDRPIARPFYALVNTDRAHPIAWLGLEHAKGPERCPPGHSLLLIQMAPAFSEAHWDAPVESLAPLTAGLAGALLGEDLGAPLWADRQGWRYALPDSGADFETLNANGAGLYFAGDYTAGQGRVHLAIASGWRAAEWIAREWPPGDGG